jgi:hypothetical protein
MRYGVPQKVVQSVRIMLNETEITNSNPSHPSCVDMSKKKKKKKSYGGIGVHILRLLDDVIAPIKGNSIKFVLPQVRGKGRF